MDILAPGARWVWTGWRQMVPDQAEPAAFRGTPSGSGNPCRGWRLVALSEAS